mgnify:CR=1 FL=1
MSASFAVGTLFDERYRLLEHLGEGGMGSVYKAQEILLDRLVAIKILHSSLIGAAASLERFQREGQLMSSLCHPHLINCFRFGIWKSSYPYIVMEYVKGVTVKQLLEAGPLSISRSLNIAIQTCDALQEAHEHGVIHRDLSPGNLMLQDDHSEDFVKVIDFGLAVLATNTDLDNQRLTKTGAAMGSIYYMSPEQGAGSRGDARSDIYALGCVLYEMVTGHPPFNAENPIEILRKHASEQPAALAGLKSEVAVPDGLENVILRALSKEPASRYQSMLAFRRDLELVVQGAGARVEPGLSLFAVKPTSVRGISLGALSIFIVAVLSSGVFFALKYRWHSEQTPPKIAASGNALPVFNRLTDPKVVEKQPLAVRIDYYRAWIAKNGDRLPEDLASARYRLGLDLQSSSPKEAKELIVLASDYYKNQFYSNLDRGRLGDVEHALGLYGVCVGNAHIEASGGRELENMLQKLEAMDDGAWANVLNSCRYELSQIYSREHKFQLGVNLCDAALRTATLYKLKDEDLLKFVILKAQCVFALGKVQEARQLLALAADRLADTPPMHLSQYKWDLMMTANGQGQADVCVKMCKRLLDEPGGLPIAGTRATILATYLSGLTRQGSFRVVFDTVRQESKVTEKSADRLADWQMLLSANLQGKLNEDKVLLHMLRAEISKLTTPAPKAEIAEMLVNIRNAGKACFDNKQPKLAEQILLCADLLLEKFDGQVADITYYPLAEVALLLRPVNSDQSEKMLRRGLAKLAPQSGDKYDLQSLLTTHLVTGLLLEKRREEALKLVREMNAQVVDEKKHFDQVISNRLLESWVLRDLGSRVAACAAANEALALSRKYGDRKGERESLLALGILDLIARHYASAETTLEQADSMFAPGDKSRYRLHGFLLEAYAGNEHFDKMSAYIDASLSLYRNDPQQELYVGLLRRCIALCLASKLEGKCRELRKQLTELNAPGG